MYKFNKVSDLAGYDNKSQHFENGDRGHRVMTLKDNTLIVRCP